MIERERVGISGVRFTSQVWDRSKGDLVGWPLPTAVRLTKEHGSGVRPLLPVMAQLRRAAYHGADGALYGEERTRGGRRQRRPITGAVSRLRRQPGSSPS